MTPLDPEQAAAVQHPAPALLVSAGPGTGKTRVLAGRIARFVSRCDFKGDEIVALTYTRSMAADLRQRILEELPDSVPCSTCSGSGTVTLDGLESNCDDCGGGGEYETQPPACGTLHALAARWVRQALRGVMAGGGAIRSLGWIRDDFFSIAVPEDVTDMIAAAHVEVRKRVGKRRLLAGLRLSGADLARWPPEAEARRQLAIRGLVTYDDLLVMLRCVVDAKGGPDEPHLRDLYPCLVIDEGQDLSPQHWMIVDAWAPKSITIVGDDAQAIFGFLTRRLPDRECLTFIDRIIMGDAPVLDISTNYRSAAPIVEASAAVRHTLAEDRFCRDLALVSDRTTQGGGAAVIRAPGPDWWDEVAVWTKSLVAPPDGLPFERYEPHHVAVLASTWDELDRIAWALERDGIPSAVPERGRDRWGSLAGRAVVALARYMDRGSIDQIDATTILRQFGCPAPEVIAREAYVKAVRERTTYAAALASMSIALVGLPDGWWSRPALSTLKLKDIASLALDAQVVSGPAFVEIAEVAASWFSDEADEDAAAPTPGDWLVWLASSESNAAVERPLGKVCLTTFHGAKGLEWRGVVVAGACEGSIPARWAKSDADVADSARALYVGMTRARDALRVVVPTELRDKPREPTRWLVRAGLIGAGPDAQQ